MFEQVKYVGSTGATCGYVNAKNRMGAFTGDTPFVVEKSGTVTFAPIENPEVGSTEDRIKSLHTQINFLDKIALCNEKK